jgi:hypothetical protein
MAANQSDTHNTQFVDAEEEIKVLKIRFVPSQFGGLLASLSQLKS